LDNLAQSLEIGLTTLQGDDVFNTAFGFDGLNALVEETNPVLVRERVRVSIIQLLRREPRIRRIVDVKLDDGRLDAAPSQVVLEEPSTTSALNRELSVRVVCEVVSGDQVAVDLGKVTQDV
jgi:phage baseplate assembly protein W